MRRKIETLSKTNLEAEAGLAKNHGETRDDFGKKATECDALRTKAGEVEEELRALCDESKTNEDKK